MELNRTLETDVPGVTFGVAATAFSNEDDSLLDGTAVVISLLPANTRCLGRPAAGLPIRGPVSAARSHSRCACERVVCMHACSWCAAASVLRQALFMGGVTLQLTRSQPLPPPQTPTPP